MSLTQLQNALGEFDFLYQIDRQQQQQQQYNRNRSSLQPFLTPGPETPAPTQPQQRSNRLSPDVYHRPVLSMPPVILMGGGGGGLGYSSPIVEMPPSPAPSHMMFIEFPDDDIDEVRFESISFSFKLFFFIHVYIC